jgi:hypothetical protein
LIVTSTDKSTISGRDMSSAAARRQKKGGPPKEPPYLRFIPGIDKGAVKVGGTIAFSTRMTVRSWATFWATFRRKQGHDEA